MVAQNLMSQNFGFLILQAPLFQSVACSEQE